MKWPAWVVTLTERARRSASRDPLLVGTFALLWIFALIPIWAPRMLPLLDLPDHLAAIGVWHRFHDATWNYEHYYRLNLLPLPYWGYFFPVHLLSYVFSIETANKIYLSAYALALPIGVAWLAHRMGRSVWLSVFAFPIVFNYNLTLGFVTFCGGLAVLFFALAALDAYMEAPSRKRAIAVFVLTLVLYFFHVLPWLFFGLSAVVLLLSHGWHPRRIGIAAGLMLPSVAIAIYAFAASRGVTAVEAGPLKLDAHFDDAMNNLQTIPTSILTASATDMTYRVMLALFAVWMTLFITARTDANDSEARAHGFAYRLEILFALSALMIFVLPGHLFKPVDLWMIAGRFVTVTAIFAVLLPHGPLNGRRKLLLIPVVVLAAYYPTQLARAWRKFDNRAESVRRLMRLVPRGSNTLVLTVGDGSDVDIDKQALPYLQFHAYAQYFAGGYDPYALSTGFPMVERKENALPAPMWKHPETFRLEQQGVFYDYVLTRNETWPHALFGPDAAGQAPLVEVDGEWRLYKVKKP